jgi:CheY-like chemotaxis protein
MNQQCVAVIEDDPDIRESLREILEFEGYKVISFQNGKEAFDRLQNDPLPHLILLDLMMPVMSGWEFLDRKKFSQNRISAVPVVVMSAVPERTAKTADMAGFIRKPVDLDTLLATVEKHLSTT